HSDFQLFCGPTAGWLEADDHVGNWLSFECDGSGYGCGFSRFAAPDGGEEQQQWDQSEGQHLTFRWLV
ncbi:MAG: hypothetical protein ACK5A3_23145, partial [Planctomyces sp.]